MSLSEIRGAAVNLTESSSCVQNNDKSGIFSLFKVFAHAMKQRLESHKEAERSVTRGFVGLGLKAETEAERCIEAAKNVHALFEAPFKGASLFEKAVVFELKIFGLFSKEKLDRHLKVQAQMLAGHYKGNLKGLVDRLNQAVDSFEKEFILSAINIAKKDIEDRQDNIGILYEVTNAKGVTSYLVGTIHMGNEAMVNQPQMVHCFQDAKEVTMEIGESVQAKLLYQLRALNPFTNFKHCMDLKLATLACQANKTVIGLETPDEQKEVLEKMMQEGRALSFPFMSEQACCYLQGHRDFISYEMVEAWQNGDDETLEFLAFELSHPAINRIMFEDRNRKWTSNAPEGKGLIQKLQETEYPIGIAVGAGHLYGGTGLIQVCKSSGLNVRRLGDAAL